MEASTVVVTRQSPHYHQNHHSSDNAPCSLLYDPRIGHTVRLRPTAPRAYRQALVEHAHGVQELTLLGFETVDAAPLIALIRQRMRALHTLRIHSLDLWSATHLQSATALSVGPTLAALLSTHLTILELKRVRWGNDWSALPNALQAHPNLQTITVDAHSTQLERIIIDNHAALGLDPLVHALATCPQLVVVQMYMSGHCRGRVSAQASASLATLIKQVQDIALHMVILPACEQWPNALATSRTLRRWHCTYAQEGNHTQTKALPWSDILRRNDSLHEVSLDIATPIQRAACWRAVAQHTRLAAVRLSPCDALIRVPAFERKPSEATPMVLEDEQDTDSLMALAEALSHNPRLTDVPAARHTSALQALLKLNQGPRGVHFRDWWNFVAAYAHDVDALRLLLRLHPQCMAATGTGG